MKRYEILQNRLLFSKCLNISVFIAKLVFCSKFCQSQVARVYRRDTKPTMDYWRRVSIIAVGTEESVGPISFKLCQLVVRILKRQIIVSNSPLVFVVESEPGELHLASILASGTMNSSTQRLSLYRILNESKMGFILFLADVGAFKWDCEFLFNTIYFDN